MKTDLQKTGRFTRKERVKNSKEVRSLFREGKKITAKNAKMFILCNGLAINRIVFSLPRGYGNAVQRNYSKRLSREAYRQLKARLNTGYDILFLVYPGNDSFQPRRAQLEYLFQKAGLIKT